MSQRVASCLLLLMATEMRLSGVHVAWAHRMDDSERAGTVNTHCWKVARVVFVSSDKGAQWANMYRGALGILKLTGVRWFGGRAYSKSEGTCVNADFSVVRDTCVLVTVEPTVVSPWLVFLPKVGENLEGHVLGDGREGESPSCISSAPPVSLNWIFIEGTNVTTRYIYF